MGMTRFILAAIWSGVFGYSVICASKGRIEPLMEDDTDTPKLMAQRDAEHWRKRAADAREVARMMTLTVTRRQMEEMAKDYERLAEEAERRAGLR
jgi:hypothetical protein